MVAVAAILILVGCGNDAERADETVPSTTTASDETQATTTEALDSEVPDLCTLFTAEDFEALTGETPGEPTSDPGVGAIRGTCTISAEAGFPLVMIAAYNESDREATLAMVDAQPVDDLGTEAYWDDTVGLVVPLEGKDWYLQVKAAGTDEDRATSVDAAKVALDRLDG
jgi:hypothetical protein